jgi:hypothetical protein
MPIYVQRVKTFIRRDSDILPSLTQSTLTIHKTIYDFKTRLHMSRSGSGDKIIAGV